MICLENVSKIYAQQRQRKHRKQESLLNSSQEALDMLKKELEKILHKINSYTKVNEVVDKNGVIIVGESIILNKLPVSASNLYAKNLFNFVLNIYDKKEKVMNINLEDEIISKTLIR